MRPGDFEQKLSRQPLKPIPADWRAEILAAAREIQASRRSSFLIRPSWRVTLKRQLTSLLWPHPTAWAGLAAVWLLALAVHFSLRDQSPELAVKASPQSPEVVAELRQQRQLYVDLLGKTETREADRPRELAPKPRSEAVKIFAS